MESELIEIVEKHLREIAGVPAEQMGSFLKDTSVHLRDTMDSLDEAIDEGEFETVVTSAHMLKGSLVNLGLEELSMVAGNIETAASSTSPLYLSCYYMRLRRELLPLLEYADK
ncbi:Hpt domain-containing protein [Desulfovibrio sp. JC010]|uniref:Hpt domain-containing protein n=1 Tax=Desulfovibrio sp. JC010 TaxID=2593641 RepID=UPI0013D3AAB2|nr:Hpt domain-containing protein [Desulfovibrio sp. JC010]NDV27011.1 Hpt domain-containing protein [Desulfovibrio sp. JC010]